MVHDDLFSFAKVSTLGLAFVNLIFFFSLNDDEKEALWERRHFLTQIPDALPLVLASAVGWDWPSLTNIYQLLDDWMPLSSVQAIELLLPQ